MGIIDTFHTFSFKGMPYFLIENDTANRATTFWIIARLIGAIGITLGSFIGLNKKSRIDRKIFSSISVLLSLSILVIVTYFPHVIPTMHIEGEGVTQIKKILEYVVILFLCLAGIMYMQQYVQKKDNSNLLFTIAIAASIFSEMSFMRYNSVYDIYNYIGHVYKFISYFIVFRVAFINNIEKLYLALYDAKNRLKKYSGDLSSLVSERTKELEIANKELNLLNQKFLDDLEYARDIQKAILPEKLPNNELVTFDAKYYPAERVSGDFYNIFRLDDHRIGMYIGDVSGHGVPAAMLTVFLNQSIKTIKELDGNRFEVINPSAVLKNLYELYNKVNFKDEVYILVLYAIFDIRTKELVYSSAGMNTQPLLVKKNNEISEIEIKGLPICNLMDFLDADYIDNTIQLDNGDRVFFYTDGLVELSNKETGESFTLEHLKEILAENNDKCCFKLYREIDRKIKGVSDINGLNDDVTFFMLQVS
jgi:sigma-B regulation protein RsbU (phosphoserine phosphatase)